MKVLEEVRRLAEPLAEESGYELVDVEHAVLGSRMVVRVLLDKPGGITVGDCARFSRRLSDCMDMNQIVPGRYQLEVSSPGIDRPLTRHKDFANWAGHEVKVNLKTPVDGNRKSLQGDLVGIEGETISVDDRKSGRVSFLFADLHAARLVLTDRLIAATRPLDSSGADEIVEEQED